MIYEGAPSIDSIPFQVEVRLPLNATDYEVELQVAGTTGGADLEDTAEVLSYFFGAVNGGAFSRGTAITSESPLELAGQEVNADGSLAFRARARDLAPGCWRILLNILAQTHYKLDPLSEVRLLAPGSPAEPLAGATDLIGCAYPERVAGIPFPVEIDEAVAGQNDFVVRIEFDAAVDDGLLEQVAERLLDWDSVVYLGGYYDDFAEMEEPQMDPSETYRLGPRSIEHRVRGWNAPAIALDSLVNIVGTLHRVSPVERVEIE